MAEYLTKTIFGVNEGKVLMCQNSNNLIENAGTNEILTVDMFFKIPYNVNLAFTNFQYRCCISAPESSRKMYGRGRK